MVVFDGRRSLAPAIGACHRTPVSMSGRHRLATCPFGDLNEAKGPEVCGLIRPVPADAFRHPEAAPTPRNIVQIAQQRAVRTRPWGL